jgi:copper resistance protein D
MTVLLVWLHMLAAVSWIGGSVFLSVVLLPVLRREPFASQRAMLIRTTALRFRVVVWGAIATLLLTGPLLLHQRGIPISNPTGWPMVLEIKLGLVAILLLFTVTHDLIIGPRVGRILQIPAERRTSSDHALVAWSPWLARSSLILTLAVLLAAVVLVRT